PHHIIYFSFFYYPRPTDIYSLSLHDALPIYTTGYIDHAAFLGTINPDTNKIPKHLFQGYLNIYNNYFKAPWMPDRTEANPETNRSEERFSRNAETDLVCRLLLEKKKKPRSAE